MIRATARKAPDREQEIVNLVSVDLKELWTKFLKIQTAETATIIEWIILITARNINVEKV